eukprot:m.541112 g.541112  ORF g.541112 m.541112 type:complete len:698 (-) comp22105_c0_seq13:52-2145(-)
MELELHLPLLPDSRPRRGAPPTKKAQREWQKEQNAPPTPVSARLANVCHGQIGLLFNQANSTTSHENGTKSCGDSHRFLLDFPSDRIAESAAKLLKLAWREQKRDPRLSVELANECRLQANECMKRSSTSLNDGHDEKGAADTGIAAYAPDAQGIYVRALFFIGKALVEQFCLFDDGIRFLAAAVGINRHGWRTRSGAGEVFHLTRALYFGTYYAEAMTLLQHINHRMFPTAWRVSAPARAPGSMSPAPVGGAATGVVVEEVKTLAPDTGPMWDLDQILHTQLGSLPCDTTANVHGIPGQAPVDVQRGSEYNHATPAGDTQVDSYHCAMLLHAFVLAAVCAPQHIGAMHACISTWLPTRYSDMWRQHNAEVRFANLILRLAPFPYQPSGIDNTSRRTDSETNANSANPVLPCDCTGHVYPLPEKVYLLGESHTLPLAWARVCRCTTTKPPTSACGDGCDCIGTGRSMLLVPRLVIGLKAWHFNPDLSQSREREILRRHARTIPPHSTVVVCAGEIDLREEGVVAMLPKYFNTARPPKYASSSIALDATVSAFCRGLCEIRDASNARCILVHPVRPVPPSSDADPTACGSFALIDEWNTRVRQHVVDLDRIRFLDFADNLKAHSNGPPPSGADTPTPQNTGSRTHSGKSADRSGEQPAQRFLDKTYDIGDGVHLNRVYLPIFATHLLQALGHSSEAAL